MNTLTIAVLLVCATMAYASVLPGELNPEYPKEAQPAAAEELLQGDESRYYGGGDRYHGGGGRYHGGGGRYHGGGGRYHGGGGRYYGHHR